MNWIKRIERIMTQEEKARRYDEALERARVAIKYPDQPCFVKVDDIFPELAESEDEKIRRKLIAFFEDWHKTRSHCWGISVGKILAWLEKQGVQKPTDKVEPKFKVGDWIVCNSDIDRVERVTDRFYHFETGDYGLIKDVDEDYHLWTIQDAKDGDVLASDDGSICVFDGTVEEGKYPFAYCGLTRYGFESYYRKLPFTHDNVCPATKEQRDLLFAKMKEAGYEWDVEKKELTKIEQKLAWSEEDEHRINDTIYFLDTAKRHYASAEELDACIDWLKSLKDRYTWKPSDEQMDMLKSACDEHWEPDGLDPLYTLYQDLKKLRKELI